MLFAASGRDSGLTDPDAVNVQRNDALFAAGLERQLRS